MTPERWKTIEALYNEIVDLPPAKRSSRLAAVSDPEVLREIQSLLATDELGASAPLNFWWTPVVDAAAAKASVDISAAPSALPKQIGHWKISGAIGRGGMGEVYLGEDLRLGRRVALKLLPQNFATRPDAIERFRQEARTASALNHPNIVTIHEIGEYEGRRYIVTEFVEGRTVRSLLANGALPLVQALDIATQTATALAAAHQAGIIHRDIKPENLMVRPDGIVKVLDFGLAKLLIRHQPASSSAATTDINPDTPPSITNAGMIFGTPGYMSPEQARGQLADARSDLFSLGALLYEMLTGQAPFTRATTIETLAALLERDPLPLEDAQGIPQGMAKITWRLLAKNPQERYQSAAELLGDLRVSNTQSQGTPVAAPLQVAPERRSRKSWITPLTAALGALALAGIAWLWTSHSSTAPWFQENRLTSIPGNPTSRTQVLSPDGRYIAYDTLLPDGKRSLSVRLLAENSVIELVRAAPVAYDALAFSPDGNYLYYVSRSPAPGHTGTLYLVPLLGGTPHKILERVADKIAFAPDGSALGFVRQSTAQERILLTVKPDGSDEREVLRSHADYPFLSIGWSPDSRDLVYVETRGNPNVPDSRILSVSRNGGQPRMLVHPGRLFVYDIAVLPDGSGFIANAFDSTVGLPQIWQIPRVGPIRHITHDLSQYQGVSLSRDGTRILASQVGRISDLWIVDRDDPTSAHVLSEPGHRFDTPAWAHDGTIVSARFQAGKWILWATDPEGGAQRPLLQKSDLDLEPSACPDRAEIVFASGRGGSYGIWRVATNGAELQQLTFGANDRVPQCVPGGAVLYQALSSGRKITMRVALDGGRPEPHAFPGYDQLVSPDGSLVLAIFADEKTHERRVGVRARDNSGVLATFSYGGRGLSWSPDSKGFADARGSEIWYQPVPAGAARQLTRFGKDTIFGLAWSPDGKRLVAARGRFNSEMVLIQDVR